MFTNTYKSFIAENCPAYDAEPDISGMSMCTKSINCYNCINYNDGKCKIGYETVIGKMLKNN